MAEEPITFTMETDKKRELEAAAVSTGRPVTDVVREAVEAYLEAYRWQADQLYADGEDDEDGPPRCRRQ